MGRPFAWSEPIFELPWFGQMPGWPGGMYAGGQGYGQGYAYPAGTPYAQPMYPQDGRFIQQQPGHSIIIRPGQPVQQVPGVVTSV